MGLPFPKGLLSDSSFLAVYSEEGKPIPLQVQVTARWKDQSIQWALLDFQVNVAPLETVSYRLECQQNFSLCVEESPLVYSQSGNGGIVNTGAASFFLNPTVFAPFARVVIDGVDVLDKNIPSLLKLTDEKNQELVPEISSMCVESQGCIRLTLRFEGRFSNMEASAFRYVARLSFFAGSSTALLRFTLHNPQAASHPGGCWDLGDDQSLFFCDLTWQIALQEAEKTVHGWNVDPGEGMVIEEASKLEIYQDSSGGPSWNSPNHMNRFGEVKQRIPGFQVARDGVVFQEGKRALPTAFVTQGDTTVAGAIQHFWQNFPKALDLHGREISLRFYPHQFDDVYELQAGEQKTHTCAIAFTQTSNPEATVNWIHQPLRPSIASEWFAGTKAIRYLSPRREKMNTEYTSLIDTAIEEPNSWFSRREQIDEYGWRHFGELYADHEAVHADTTQPFISHYNNQYDAMYGLLIEYLRTGDERWFTLAGDLAKHVVDIDIYHTRDDRACYNGGLFWHSGHYLPAATATHRTFSQKNIGQECADSSSGGGPSGEHNYTTGLLYYYFLTGDPLAAETVVGLADWVINMDDPQGSVLGKFDSRPTGSASMTVELTYHGPGRGSGNSVNALLDAYVLTRDKRYLQKAEELIQRCIHPHDNIARHHLEDIEHRWSYTIFLVTLGKYLDLKVAEEEIDYVYAYAREAISQYAAWMVEHEVPYKGVLHRVAIPTETWSAQDMRKSHVLNVAAKYTAEPLSGACRSKARLFYDACLADLSSFPTHMYTRPVVLVMTNGFVQAYVENDSEEPVPQPIEDYDFGHPKIFHPQGAAVYQVRALLVDLFTSIKRCVALLKGGGIQNGVSR